MLSDNKLRQLLRDLEADNVERTVSIGNTDKFGEAICACANDLPGRGETGVLIIGADDRGECKDIAIDEKLTQTLLAFRDDGRISPFPLITVHVRELDGCELLVVEVEPSDNPPLRYKGRTCIRIGQRRGYATAEEERRLTEKRRWSILPFDHRPVTGATIADLDQVRFLEEYLPAAIHPDVLADNHRDPMQQMIALRLLHPQGAPTVAGLLVIGKDCRQWLPGAYIQFVRYPGPDIGDTVLDHREVSGVFGDQMRMLDELIDLHISNAADLAASRQQDRRAYPPQALREIMRNALIHRTYEGTAAPVRISWFSDRIETTSPGGPYGAVTIENFGTPGPTDYRNPALADAARALGYVQKFGSGIARAKAALAGNGNPEAKFQAEVSYINVTVWATR